MLAQISEAAAVTWPLAITLASVAACDRFRAARRREALNRALHELRRPLQALVLASPSSGAEVGCSPREQVELALDALADLDREVNGAGSMRPLRREDARGLAAQAVDRWHRQAALGGRRLELAWRAGTATVVCDPSRIARALDNLLANALEHGGPRVRLEGTRRAGRLRLVVVDEADPGPRREPSGAGAGGPVRARRRSVDGHRHRGHGLRIVAGIAAEHGGRFAICRHERGASAVLELPLAE